MTTGFSSSSSIAFGVKGTTFLSSNPEKKSGLCVSANAYMLLKYYSD